MVIYAAKRPALSRAGTLRNRILLRLATMRSCLNKGTTGFITAALIVLVGQAGRLPIPARYRTYGDDAYAQVAAASRSSARTADVIIMGDSRTLFGIDVEVLADRLKLPTSGGGRPKVAMLAVYGVTADDDYWIWRRIAAGPRPPRARLAIIGLWEPGLMRNSPGADTPLRYLYQAPDVLWLLRQGRINDAASLLAYRMLPTYARQGSLRCMIGGTPDPLTRIRPGRGPWTAETETILRALRPNAFKGYRKFYRNYAIDPSQVLSLERMVAGMKAQGVRVFLVSLPVDIALLRMAARRAADEPARSLQGDPGSPLRLYKSAIRGVAERTGVPYLDYMRADEVRQYEYPDPSHMTAESAVRFTRALAAGINAELDERAPSHPRS
jgi:hypothetical protein